MTSSIPTNARRLRRGFTLVEMLVVIGIILLLIGIATPMINRAYKTAVRTRMAADLQVISMGLEAYKGDFKDYPRLDYAAWVANPNLSSPLNAPPPPPANQPTITPGAVLLCWALVGPGPMVPPASPPPKFAADGADGPGFRTRGTSGQVYGPYIATGRFKVSDLSNPGATSINDALCTINDRYGHPILYFAAGLGTNSTARSLASNAPSGNPAYVTDWMPPSTNPRPTFNAHDNLTAFVQASDPAGTTALALKRIQMMLGDKNHDGILSPGEVQPANVPYLLWSPGTDEMYGPTFDMTAADGDIASKLNTVDDVTNFNP